MIQYCCCCCCYGSEGESSGPDSLRRWSFLLLCFHTLSTLRLTPISEQNWLCATSSCLCILHPILLANSSTFSFCACVNIVLNLFVLVILVLPLLMKEPNYLWMVQTWLRKYFVYACLYSKWARNNVFVNKLECMRLN